MKISIVIPAHNEEKRISRTLEEYGKFFRQKKSVKKISDFEITVVLNACEDKTLEVVKRKIKKNKEIRCLEFEKKGKGFAIIEGFKYALKKDFDLIGFVDADMATPPEAFYELVRGIGDSDGAIASRWLKESKIKTKQSLLRRVTSKGFNFLERCLLFMPYKDTQCGAKLFRKEAIGTVINDLGITNWAFDIDLLYRLRKKGAKIREIPTVWEDKKESKLNLTTVPFQMLSSIIRLRILYSPLRGIVALYDKLPERIKFHHK